MTPDPLNTEERQGWSNGDAPSWQTIVVPALQRIEEGAWLWQDVEGDYSQWIEKIVGFLTLCGVTVEIGPPDDPNIDPQTVGRTQYEPIEMVWIFHPKARGAMLTAAHEAGHLLSYWRYRTQTSDPPPVEVRERMAYLYGWVVLRWLDIPVTKDEWQAFDSE